MNINWLPDPLLASAPGEFETSDIKESGSAMIFGWVSSLRTSAIQDFEDADYDFKTFISKFPKLFTCFQLEGSPKKKEKRKSSKGQIGRGFED